MGKQIFGLFKDLCARFPWQTSLKNQGTQGNNLILQDSLLKPQKWSIVAGRKSQGNGRKQAGWTGNSCLSLNAEIQRRLKQEEVTQKEYGDCAHAEELEQAKDAKKKQGIVI